MTECPVCYTYFYTVPLPCNHILCTSCLEKLLKKGPKCPLCRRDLFDDNLDNLLNNCQDSNVLCFLGFLHRNGYQFICKDTVQEVQFYLKSAKLGNQYAQCFLGYKYMHGSGINPDIKKAVKYTRLSAEQGNIVAQTNMVYFYVHGFDQKTISLEEMLKWHELTIDKCPFSKGNTGLIHYYGYGVPQDKEKAKEFFRLASEDTRDGDYHLGMIYEEEGLYDKAYSLYYQVYSNRTVHHREASGKLGYLHHFGLGCLKSSEVALKHYFLDRDNPVTQYHLGIYYEETDIDKSKKWYQLSAKAGYVPSIYNLAVMETDEKKKIKMYKKLDDPDAQCNLANIYLNKGNVNKAVELYKKSAKNKNVYACYNLSLLYRQGMGVKKSYKKALKYMDLSLKIDL
jgi:TPR repeat protein